MREAHTRKRGIPEDSEGLSLVFHLMYMPLMPFGLVFVVRGWRAEAVGHLIKRSQGLADVVFHQGRMSVSASYVRYHRLAAL